MMMMMIDSDDDYDNRRRCASCGQVGDSVSYVSKYGRGLICQRCNDEETNRPSLSSGLRLPVRAAKASCRTSDD